MHSPQLIFAECDPNDNPQSRRVEQVLRLSENQKSRDTLITFDYTNESLINIINQLAVYQGINILFPADGKKVDVEVTLNYPNKISLEEGWSIANTFLEIAGFSIVPKGITYEIVLSKDANKESLPTYINIHPEKLPNSDNKIRYLYYMQNINLGNTNNKSKANIESILKDMLSGIPSTNNYTVDPKSNCIIITNKTSNIKAVMNILIALDREGFSEAIEIVPLRHANANTIVELLKEIIQGKKNTSSFRYAPYGSSASKDEDLYFSKNTNVVPIDRSNSIAIMGKVDSVSKIKNFIIKYLDVAIDSGKSIIHIKRLQHLDANKELAQVLQRIVKSKAKNSQSSSRKDALSEVIITAEDYGGVEKIQQLEIKEEGKTAASKDGKKATASSNNLIIAAREPEWKLVEHLIDEIDQPQPQIAIEALIVDLGVSNNGKIAAQSRNINLGGDPQGVNFQSGHISQPWLNYTPTTTGTGTDAVTTYAPSANGLASNLLTAGSLKDDGTLDSTKSILDSLTAGTGSTLLSFNDGNGIAALLEMVKGYSNAKVLSQPFVTTTNHQQAAISLATERIVAGSVKQQSVGGPTIIKNETIKADLKIDILPRISKAGNINLEILVTASEFATETAGDNTILRRKVQTNANVENKQVLVIGGLTKIKNTNSITSLPLVSKIPIIGNLFKKRSQKSEKSTLMIFLSPKIIQPRKGVSKFVQHKLDMIEKQISDDELAFDNLADPITRILFPAQAPHAKATIDKYAGQEIFNEPKKGKGPISKNI